MAAKPVPEKELKRTQRAYEQTRSIAKAAAALGVSEKTVRRRLAARPAERALEDEVTLTPAADEDIPIDELVAFRRRVTERKISAHRANQLQVVKVKLDGPIAITHIGDPHIDDDGCDIAQLEHDLTTVGRTEGMFAGHIGDLTNNWIGRLARLYAHQSTTGKQAVKLAEWMLGLAPNLYVVGGNHDMWQGSDLLSFILAQRREKLSPHGVRLALQFPNGREVKVNARHDFPGHSQYNNTHGHRKETLFGHRDHLLIAGHKHVDGAAVTPSVEGIAHWMFRVSGYKVVDSYAEEHNFHENRLAPSITTIIDPGARVEAELIKPYWDVEEAADVLTYKRRRAGQK